MSFSTNKKYKIILVSDRMLTEHDGKKGMMVEGNFYPVHTYRTPAFICQESDERKTIERNVASFEKRLIKGQVPAWQRTLGLEKIQLGIYRDISLKVLDQESRKYQVEAEVLFLPEFEEK